MIEDIVIPDVPASQSLLLRYYPMFQRIGLHVPTTYEDLAACSHGEGARIVPAGDYKGVSIYVLDETTLMATGTYKDLDACMTTAIARHNGIDRVVASSGGNLAYALARYGARTGLGVIVFQPKSTLYKLDASVYGNDHVKLVAVDRPEKEVKQLAHQFARRFGIIEVPDIRWRLAASAVRAAFIIEHTFRPGEGLHCLAQTMCAGFGPVGIYNCLSSLVAQERIDRAQVPRFIGFQQSANSTMVRAWEEGSREIAARHVVSDPSQYLEPGLYNTNPGRNYTRLYDLMSYFGGDLLEIDSDDYHRHQPDVLSLLSNAGIELTRNRQGEVIERTGLLTGIGILRAIEAGRIRPGERVAFLLTGGARVAATDPRVVTPSAEVDNSRSLDEWVVELGKRFGMSPLTKQRVSDKLFGNDPFGD